jgi:hypothetical protein
MEVFCVIVSQCVTFMDVALVTYVTLVANINVIGHQMCHKRSFSKRFQKSPEREVGSKSASKVFGDYFVDNAMVPKIRQMHARSCNGNANVFAKKICYIIKEMSVLIGTYKIQPLIWHLSYI